MEHGRPRTTPAFPLPIFRCCTNCMSCGKGTPPGISRKILQSGICWTGCFRNSKVNFLGEIKERPLFVEIKIHGEGSGRSVSDRNGTGAQPAPEIGTRPLPGQKPPIRISHPWYESCRRKLEFLGALVLLVLFAPVIGLATFLVKITSAGPMFYSQTRVGRNGLLFSIYKIRTMIHNCESVSGVRWSAPGDSRITPVGKILRKTHVDELPQLINVLLGHMSLIGPRPERPEFLKVLQQALTGYRDRLLICPGITGLAQIQLPPDTDLNSVRRKLAYDLFYIENLHPVLDLQILAATIFYALKVPFPTLRSLCRLPKSKVVLKGVELSEETAPFS